MPTKRCYELIARTPHVILERSHEPSDYTHLQLCGAPVYKYGKCVRHQDGNKRLSLNWLRFIRRGG